MSGARGRNEGGPAARPDVIPGIRYRDARAAIDWLCRVLGFREHLVVAGPGTRVLHAELLYGNGVVMLGSDDAACEVEGVGGPALGESRIGLYLVTEDPDAAHARAAREGAEIVVGLHDTPYGSRQFAVRDPEGVVWTLGTHRPPSEKP